LQSVVRARSRIPASVVLLVGLLFALLGVMPENNNWTLVTLR
jgi:hypothetical protein